jgi:hypothetical protein
MTMAARPGGLIPEHLWLASDEEKTVISVLAPEVAGTARHDTVGPVTMVSPYPVNLTGPGGIRESRLAEVELHTPRSRGALIGWAGTAGSAVLAAAGVWAVGVWAGAAVAATGIGVSVWQGLRRYSRVAEQWVQGCQVLTNPHDKAAIEGAAKNVRFTTAAWPKLRAHVDLDDPGLVLVRQLWDLTLIVGERATARELRQRLALAGVGVPAGTATAAELADRIARADAAMARLDADIDQRRTHLWRLADEVDTFVTEQQALTRAAATIRDADRVRGVPATSPADGAGDLADHTAAVLAAYCELTQSPG